MLRLEQAAPLSLEETENHSESEGKAPMGQTANLETTAGIFLLLGLAFVCGIILLIGEVPDLFKPTYNLTARFPDASGLVKGADVYLSGALIGKVMTDPHPISGTQTVQVKLKINRSVKLRQDARYTIESSGLFGDKFLNVSPIIEKPGVTNAPFVQNGETVQGTQEPDLSALMTASLPLIHTANHAAGELDDMITRLNTDVLTPAAVSDLKATFSKFSNVKTDSKSLGNNFKDLISDVKSGDSALGKLLYDKQVRDNLADFIASYKAHGAIFYSDDTAPAPTNLRPRPAWRARP